MKKEEIYKNISNTVIKCMKCEDKNKRIIYGIQILKALDEIKKDTHEAFNIAEKLIDKLVSASKTIQDQNDWIDCLHSAIGENYDIIHVADVSYKTLNKKRNKKED